MSYWKKLLSEPEPAKSQPEIVPHWEGDQRCYALYLFNSNEISDKASGFYGAYAEGECLKALHKVLGKDGWMFVPVLSGCHGDLFKDSIEKLGKWLGDGTHGIDTTNFDPATLEALRSQMRLGFIPYVIGVGILQTSHDNDVHQEMKALGVVGYLGLLLPNTAPSLVDVASDLHLPYDLRIQSSQCSGWLASNNVLREIGLYAR